MRELIDRQTALEMIRDSFHPEFFKHYKPHEQRTILNRYQAIVETINTVPTVTRMQEESYQRLIGKKVGR